MKRASRFVAYVGDRLGDERFTLIDVGCSGGIDAAWRQFGDRLTGFGFDPNIEEVRRLQAAGPGGFQYVPAFVGLPPSHPFHVRRQGRDYWGRNPWDRLSVARAIALREEQNREASVAELTQQNLWDRVPQADASAPISLPEFFATEGVRDVDFLKLDVDGPDYEILVSLESSLEPTRCLGLMVEMCFFGTDSPDVHTFHNVDRYLKRLGYELFDLEVRRYSTRALPAPFIGSQPSQTTFGRPLQGDAVYLRDLANLEFRGFADAVSDAKLLKLACLFDLFNLPDCAAEILQVFGSRLGNCIDIEHALDLLVPTGALQATGNGVYREYIRSFESGDPCFFNAEHADVKHALDAVRNSTSWRITEPLRQAKTWFLRARRLLLGPRGP